MANSQINMAQDVIIQNNWEFCDLCKDNDEINWKCLQCRQHLCERCKTGHINGRITREHLVFHKEKENEEDELLRLYTCGTHANKDIIMYCKTDNIPVCTICIEDDHQGHTLVSLGKVADDKRNEIEQAIEPGEQILTIHDTELTAICENGDDNTEWNFYARKQVLETKTEIEKVLNVVANEMMDEYDRKCRTFSSQCLDTKLGVSLRRAFTDKIIQEAQESVQNLRDIEIIRKSDSVLQNAQIINKSAEAKRGKQLQFAKLEIQKADLRKMMLETLTRESYHTSVTYSGGSSLGCMAVICIYIGANKLFVGLSLLHEYKSDPCGHNIFHLCIEDACSIIDDDMDILELGKGCFLEVHKDVHNHHVSMDQVIMKEGKIYFISENGKLVDGNELFKAILLHLKKTACGNILSRLKDNYIDEKNIFWQIIYSEFMDGHENYFAKDLESNIKLEKWSLCSDAEACIRYRSMLPNTVSLKGTPCIVLEIGQSIIISTRHVNQNGDSQILQKPLLCPGFSEIPKQWINIMKHLVGEENVSLSTWRTTLFTFTHSFSFKLQTNKKFTFSVMLELLKRMEIPLQQSEYAKDIMIRNSDKVQFSNQLLERQVEDIMKNVYMNIRHTISMPGMPPISSLLLLGDFCNHSMIKESIQKHFPNIHISSETYDSVSFGGIDIGWSTERIGSECF